MGEEQEQPVVLGDYLRSSQHMLKDEYLRFKQLAKKGNTMKGRCKVSVPYGRTKR